LPLFQIPGPSVFLKDPPKGKNAAAEEGDEEEGEDYEAKIVISQTRFLFSLHNIKKLRC